jgi:hypothetical protein
MIKISNDVLKWLNGDGMVKYASVVPYWVKPTIVDVEGNPRLGYGLFCDASLSMLVTVDDITTGKDKYFVDVSTIPSPPKEIVWSLKDDVKVVDFIGENSFEGYVEKMYT